MSWFDDVTRGYPQTAIKPEPASDRDTLDAIATLLGTSAEWNGADMLEDIANLIGKTDRPHPGDKAETYLQEFAQATGRTCPGEWDFTPDVTIGAGA